MGVSAPLPYCGKPLGDAPISSNAARQSARASLVQHGYAVLVFGYTAGFTGDAYDELRSMFRRLGARQRRFDANNVAVAIVSRRLVRRTGRVTNVSDIRTVLRDMEDLGYVRSVPRDPQTGLAAWEYLAD